MVKWDDSAKCRNLGDMFNFKFVFSNFEIFRPTLLFSLWRFDVIRPHFTTREQKTLISRADLPEFISIGERSIPQHPRREFSFCFFPLTFSPERTVFVFNFLWFSSSSFSSFGSSTMGTRREALTESKMEDEIRTWKRVASDISPIGGELRQTHQFLNVTPHRVVSLLIHHDKEWLRCLWC